MRCTFRPRLVNDLFGDPCVFVDIFGHKRAVLFDLGDITALSAREILRLSDVCISHTHIDHFYGFDRLLRVCLGREKRLRLYGPPGTIERVSHKLMGYTWNLIERFPNQLVFEVHELDESDRVSRVELSSQVRFARSPRSETTTNQGLLFRDSVLELRACVVEHHIPVLAYSLRERAHIGVNKSKLSGLGLDTGAWLSRVKRALQQDREQARQLLEALYPELAPEAVLRCFIEERGEHLGYVVDTAYHPRCRDRLAAILSEANHLFLEARFLEEDRDRAAERAHLSTTQCAELARELRAKRLTPIHFSTRNEGQSARFIEEVMRSFLAPEPN